MYPECRGFISFKSAGSKSSENNRSFYGKMREYSSFYEDLVEGMLQKTGWFKKM